ncbi:pollen-specific leucine-rich repeat extensin-like protein 4 [Iris pallida]|uniref:Pollen-specific leucine-rich repeat extensin-like protein 4 n=1 Tax=Iris pallida TaxID=29817 RepID=A0AAX6ENV0_IRIPA|nr:pollen-specific leucine-rich repeat extensin-like protein 4 [Iris pallida]
MRDAGAAAETSAERQGVRRPEAWQADGLQRRSRRRGTIRRRGSETRSQRTGSFEPVVAGDSVCRWSLRSRAERRKR